MKKNIAILTLLLFGFSSFCQTVQLGNESDNSSFQHIPIILHKDNSRMYVLRISKINPQGFKIIMDNNKAGLSAFLIGYGRANSDDAIMNLDTYYGKSNEYALEVYDNAMNLQKSYPFSVVLEKAGMMSSSGNKAIFIKKACFLNNKIVCFSTLYDSKLKKTTIGYYFLSTEGVLDKQITPLAEVNTPDDELEKRVTFTLSPDQSKVVMYYPLKPDSKNPQTRLFVEVIDATSLTSLWENEFTLGEKGTSVSIENVIASNNGAAYILSKNELKGEEKDKSAQKYKYMLYSASKENKALEDFNLKLGDQYFMNNVLLKLGNDNQLYATGFYSEKSANFAKGAFIMVKDLATKELKLNTLVPFTQNISEDDKEASDKEKAFYHMRGINVTSDGNVVLTGEQYYIDISRGGGLAYSAMSTPDFYYRYKNILVMMLKPTGELIWMKDIPKKQFTANDGALYSSFISTVINNKISVMFNGHKDGLDKRMSGFTDNNMVYMLEFDSKGNMTTKTLYSGEEAQTRLCPKISYCVNDKEFILYNVRRSGKYRFAKVDF